MKGPAEPFSAEPESEGQSRQVAPSTHSCLPLPTAPLSLSTPSPSMPTLAPPVDGFRILFLFAGFAGSEGGVDAILTAMGGTVDMIDLKVDPVECDILEDTVWDGVAIRILNGIYDACLIAAPTSTSGVARGGQGGDRGVAPPAVRGEFSPDIYGLPGLSPHDKEIVRKGTLLALRSRQAAGVFCDLGRPWAWEAPAVETGCPSIFKLPEVLELDSVPGVRDFMLPRRVLRAGCLKNAAVKSFKLCLDLPCETDLNLEVARAVVAAILASRGDATAPTPQVRQLPAQHAGQPRVQFANPLRGRTGQDIEAKAMEDWNCLAGMRDCARAVQRLPGILKAGAIVNQLLDKVLSSDATLAPSVSELLSGRMDDDALQLASARLDEALGRPRDLLGKILGCSDVSAVDGEVHSTGIRARLLHRWAVVAQDPGAGAATWCWEGAPAGVTSFPTEVDAVFPRCADISVRDGHSFDDEAISDDVVRSRPVQAYDHADAELDKFVQQGFLRRFRTLGDLRKHLGAEPVLSRFAVLEKVRNGRVKRRLILDLKRSGMSARTAKTHRVVLPRVSDAVADALFVLADIVDGESFEWLVLDFSDAFWNVPLRDDERRYFVGILGEDFYLCLRAAQGSRNGPLTWAGVASLALRLLQGVLCACGAPASRPRARLQLYVDDPVLAMRGWAAQLDVLVAKLVIVWRLLGFPLAFRKAARGPAVVWIGAHMAAERDKVVVSIPQDKLDDLLASVRGFLRSNVIAVKALRSFAGVASHVASLVYAWRPFLFEVWGALKSAGSGDSRAPPRCIWTSQCRPALLWIEAFLTGKQGSICITYRLDAFLNQGVKIRIVGDASPWGFGTFIVVDGVIKGWYAAKISEAEAAEVGYRIGDAAGQQYWEALNLLVALRIWKAEWMQHRVKLEVRADNVTALTLVASLKASSPALTRLARELALDLGDAAFRPDVVSHTPGVASGWADRLSRIHQPGCKDRDIPSALAPSLEVTAPPRESSFWRLGLPAHSAEQRGVGGECGMQYQ